MNWFGSETVRVLMSAQVIFFPLKHQPNREDQRRLAFIQEQLELYHAELAYKSKGLNQFNTFLFKQSSHQKVRDSWKVLAGGKSENGA